MKQQKLKAFTRLLYTGSTLFLAMTAHADLESELVKLRNMIENNVPAQYRYQLDRQLAKVEYEAEITQSCGTTRTFTCRIERSRDYGYLEIGRGSGPSRRKAEAAALENCRKGYGEACSSPGNTVYCKDETSNS